jgi:uncharacterized protein (TIGR02118 family)
MAISRRTALALGSAVLVAPSFSATSSESGIKAVVLVARKEGMTREAFTRHWLDIHAALASSVEGVKGFVGSEPIGATADGKGAPFAEMDGIASIWYPSREQVPGILGTEKGKAWLADGDLFISRPLSRNYGTREHVIVRGPRISGTVKESFLLVRDQSIEPRAFIDRLLDANANLARKLPGLSGCVFSEVTNGNGPEPKMDAMIELWSNAKGAKAEFSSGSPAAAEWKGDLGKLVDKSRTRRIVSRELVALAPPGY